MEIKEVPINQLIPSEYNPRALSEREYKDLRESLVRFDLVEPFVVNSAKGRENIVIGGHQRLKIAKDLGYKTVPVHYVKITKLDKERELNLRLNKNLGHWDYDLLANYDEGVLIDVGFNPEELDLIMQLNDNTLEHELLSEKFIVPPFSVLDSRQGYWQRRKKRWMKIIGNAVKTRDGLLFKTRGRTRAGWKITKIGLTSKFDPVLAEVIYRWFNVEGGKILDPFAGEQVKGVVAGVLKYHYYGVDIRAEQVKWDEYHTKKWDNIHYFCGDAVNLDKLIKERDFDLVFTSPPYYDLEIYSKEDLSALGSYEEFMDKYRIIFNTCYKMLKDNRFLVVKVGEIRNRKTGDYRDFVADNIKMFRDIGFKFCDDVILLQVVGSASLRAKRVFKYRKVVKIHQNILVFYKGNLKEIKNTFPELDLRDIEDFSVSE